MTPGREVIVRPLEDYVRMVEALRVSAARRRVDLDAVAERCRNLKLVHAADRSRLETLATCAFIREADNVLFMGPPGVGKSHLAVALGVKAIKNGFSTTHFVLDDLMHVLKGEAAIPPRRLEARR